MVNVVVTGAAGRMGTQIVRLVAAAEDLKLAGAVERPGHAGQDAGALAGLPPLGVTVVDDLGKALAAADVVIDFTSHRGVGAATPSSAPTRAWRSSSARPASPPRRRRASPPPAAASRSSSRPT